MKIRQNLCISLLLLQLLIEIYNVDMKSKRYWLKCLRKRLLKARQESFYSYESAKQNFQQVSKLKVLQLQIEFILKDVGKVFAFVYLYGFPFKTSLNIAEFIIYNINQKFIYMFWGFIQNYYRYQSRKLKKQHNYFNKLYFLTNLIENQQPDSRLALIFPIFTPARSQKSQQLHTLAYTFYILTDSLRLHLLLCESRRREEC